MTTRVTGDTSNRICPHCRAEVPSGDSLEGLCPGCLIRFAFPEKTAESRPELHSPDRSTQKEEETA